MGKFLMILSHQTWCSTLSSRPGMEKHLQNLVLRTVKSTSSSSPRPWSAFSCSLKWKLEFVTLVCSPAYCLGCYGASTSLRLHDNLSGFICQLPANLVLQILFFPSRFQTPASEIARIPIKAGKDMGVSPNEIFSNMPYTKYSKDPPPPIALL